MAVNLAKKYQKAIDQAYALGSLTKIAFAGKFDFIGSATAVVYTLTSQALTDYTRSGSDRYGSPAELQDTTNEYTISKDRSFSITVDKGNFIQGNLVKTTGAVTKIQMDEQFIPEQDAYNLTVIAAAAVSASNVSAATAITASNAYSEFLAAGEALDEDKVPAVGRICFCTPTFYKFIKLDDTFVKASDMGMKVAIKGVVGEIDGTKIVKVPTSYLPANTDFLITHPRGNVAPMQLNEIKVHKDAPGISGALIEGRFIYDAFVMDAKEDGCYKHINA